MGWEPRIQFWTYSVVAIQTEMSGKEGIHTNLEIRRTPGTRNAQLE